MLYDAEIYCAQGPDVIEPAAQGSLSGTTFVFKDLFDVQGYRTGAGNPRWLATHDEARFTSPLIQHLLNQGARCVGRVQNDELAYSLNGKNKHYGTLINPAAPDCVSGGSSSGSAVAVAGHECDFSIGTDTGGSVRVPASYCGLFGLRPTLGSLNLKGCFEFSKSFDAAGIFTRDLTLMRNIWQTFAGSRQCAEVANAIYLDDMFIGLLGEDRLCRLKEWCRQSTIQLVQGRHLTEYEWDMPTLCLISRTIQAFEMLKKNGEWITNNIQYLDKSIADRIGWGQALTLAQYEQALRDKTVVKDQLISFLCEQGYPMVIPTAPSGPPALSMPDAEMVEYRKQVIELTCLSGIAGLPQLHLPMRDLEQGPGGISLIGLANQEALLISTGEVLSLSEK